MKFEFLITDFPFSLPITPARLALFCVKLELIIVTKDWPVVPIAPASYALLLVNTEFSIDILPLSAPIAPARFAELFMNFESEMDTSPTPVTPIAPALLTAVLFSNNEVFTIIWPDPP